MSLFRFRSFKNSFFKLLNVGKGLFGIKVPKKDKIDPIATKMYGKFEISNE